MLCFKDFAMFDSINTNNPRLTKSDPEPSRSAIGSGSIKYGDKYGDNREQERLESVIIDGDGAEVTIVRNNNREQGSVIVKGDGARVVVRVG